MSQYPYKCSNCGRAQPFDFAGWKCPVCGGVFNLSAPAVFDPQQIVAHDHTLWRYRHTFPLPADAQPVTLGEGGTPLVSIEVGERTVHFKMESLNPTGSFKDRGMAVMFTALKVAGVGEAIEDSSGNAGAAFAGYAARVGVRARVFVPASASGPKRNQIAAYGAEVVAVDGPRSKASEAAQTAAALGAPYASHIYNPLGLAGNATAAYEIWEALGHAPESVVLPLGHGTLLLGMHRGFKALQEARLIERLPKLIGVQAMACAPIWAVHAYGRDGLAWVTEGETIAEGIRVRHPVRGDAVLAAVAESGGTLLAVDDPAIRAGRDALARLGLYVEPTCGVVWEALKQVSGEVVVMLTGNGLKS
ncbi:MAG: pyridoxal-phosphate dependent enzyme [Anaerolineales bacterium]